MAHTSLYRTYRPQTFSDVVGQSHVTRTLANAVGQNQVAHAYLFTGPRGTGKTTTARILAKALLCEKGPTAEPDGTCEQCIEIAEGRHPDVFELDAASRTGVDNVREEIIGRVQFAPSRGRYKLYIIDEVHMLSTAAFNALLKTLEEPPPHVVFVLATTHPHKVPETIQSRCQRFDFRRISVEDIAERLRVISDGESIKVPDAALALMAKHAAGGMRDAITTLEQLAAFTGDNITLADVEGLLGEVDFEQLYEVGNLVAARDIAGLFRWTARFAETGADMAEFVRSLTGHVRDLYVIAAVGDGVGIVDATNDNAVRLASQAAEFGIERLARILDLLGELGSEMRWSSDPRLSLEVALTRMARPQGELTLEALDERMASLEAGSQAVAIVTGAIPPPAASVPAPVPAPADSAVRVEPQTPPPPVAVTDRAAVKRAWPGVLAEIKKLKSTRAYIFTAVEVDVDSDGETVVIEFPRDQDFAMKQASEDDNRHLLRAALAAVFGSAPPFRYQLGRGAVRTTPEPVAPATPPQAEPEPSADAAYDEEAIESAAFEGDDPAPAEGPPPGEHATPLSDPAGVSASSASGVSPDLAETLSLLGAEVVAEHPHDASED